MPRKGEADEIFEALVEACGGNLAELTRNERGKYNAAAKQLREVNATPAEILRRAKQYRYHHRDWPLTAMALVSHWSEFARTLPPRILPDPVSAMGALEEELTTDFEAAGEPGPLGRLSQVDPEEATVRITPEMLAQMKRSIGRTM